jgi:DNA mismatch repair protein MutS
MGTAGFYECADCGELERELFERLRGTVAEATALCQAVGRTLAELDALAALAVHAAENDWCRPEVVAPGPLRIEAGRHPVVERTTDFVPNDLVMDRDRSFLLVTGPNMSGKSTYMRQAALVALLAQAGSFVPADRATVGVVDGIYTRVGALDELARGRSTFMVEMSELSRILHAATDESLVVLDEVGRGTATYDGVSIAWAATEQLSSARAPAPSPLVLFATHYHELTELAGRIDGVANVHMAADERGDDVTFLRTVADGPADRSYGVHVAELAGVPEPVVERAREVLDRLREDEAIEVAGGESDGEGDDEPRQVVFDLERGDLRAADGEDAADGGDAADDATDPAAAAVLDELRGTAVDEVAPIDLAARVREWQRTLRTAGEGDERPGEGDERPGEGTRGREPPTG